MNRILFIDVTCPRPYDGNTLETQAQGGSESSVTRVAEALARRGHAVRLTQHNCAERLRVNGVEHTPLNEKDDFSPTHVVAFRAAETLDDALKRWPGATGYAWYQDFPEPGPGFVRQAEALVRNRARPVLVSNCHEMAWRNYLGSHGFAGRVVPKRIYNAIPDDLLPDDTLVDPDKFVFFSSPHKGLRETLEVFARFQDYPELKDARLYVANPGYRHADDQIDGGRVVNLGPLPWKRVIDEVRSAFLVFHYNPVFPETFGLVHAEADAVGTPWLSGFLGANPEICDDPDEMADLDDPEGVIERIIEWRTGERLKVEGSPQFRISKVADEWEAFLAS